MLVVALIAVPLGAALIVGFERLVPGAVNLICSTIDSAGVGSCFG